MNAPRQFKPFKPFKQFKSSETDGLKLWKRTSMG